MRYYHLSQSLFLSFFFFVFHQLLFLLHHDHILDFSGKDQSFFSVCFGIILIILLLPLYKRRSVDFFFFFVGSCTLFVHLPLFSISQFWDKGFFIGCVVSMFQSKANEEVVATMIHHLTLEIMRRRSFTKRYCGWSHGRDDLAVQHVCWLCC